MKRLLCGIAMTLLLSSHLAAQNVDSITVNVLAKATSSWDGSTLPNYERGKPEITILKVIIPPKTKAPLHKHPVISAGVLLKGVLTVVTEDEKILHLKAGDAAIEVVDKWHYGENEGDEPAEIILFYAAISGQQTTIKKALEK